MYEKSCSAATNLVHGRWILWTVLALCCTTMLGALDLGPESADWPSAVGAASPGSAIFFRPGVYHGCDVSIPSGLVERGRGELAPAAWPAAVDVEKQRPNAWQGRRCCRAGFQGRGGGTAAAAVGMQPVVRWC